MILESEYIKAKQVVKQYEAEQLHKNMINNIAVAYCSVHKEEMYLNKIGQWECIKCTININ